MAKGQRQSNIELLRLLAMVGVILLHYNNKTIGGGLAFVPAGSVNEYVLLVLESAAICGVNLFIMISGYFLSQTNHRSVGKMLSLVLQVCLFSCAWYLIRVALGQLSFSVTSLAYSFLPANWFIILYAVLYLISPLINRAFANLKSIKVLLGLLFLFSIWPTILDVFYKVSGTDLTGSLSTLGTFGTGRGYTIVNFLLCYVIGAAFHWFRTEKLAAWKLIVLYFANLAVITLWSVRSPDTAWEYCNPLVILEAAVTFALFLRIDLGCRKWINTLARAALTVYLIHQYFLPYLKIEEYVQKNVFVMLLQIVVSVLIIVAVSFLVDLIYRLILGRLNRWLSQKWQYTL